MGIEGHKNSEGISVISLGNTMSDLYSQKGLDSRYYGQRSIVVDRWSRTRDVAYWGAWSGV